jgi:YceI-like protein
MEFDHYAIDATLSRVTLRAFASAASPLGNSPTVVIQELAGWARFGSRTFDQPCIRIKIKAGSLTVVESMSEEDRSAIESTMMRYVLEIDKYPEILFCSSRVSVSKAGQGQYWINLIGDLSLHGVTGSLPIAAQMALVDNTLRAQGEFTLLHTSYKMKLVSLPGGRLKLKDEVTCSFDILARKQTDLAKQKDRIFASEGL